MMKFVVDLMIRGHHVYKGEMLKRGTERNQRGIFRKMLKRGTSTFKPIIHIYINL